VDKRTITFLIMSKLPKNLLLTLLLLIPLFFVLTVKIAEAQVVLPGDIVFKVTTDKRQYAIGEDVSITIKAINKSLIPYTLRFSSSRQATYLIGRYLESAGKQFDRFPTAVEIPAGSSYEWNFIHKSSDYELEEGDHTIFGLVVGYGGESAKITVGTPTSPIVVKVSTDKPTYTQDENVGITVKAKNKSSEIVVLSFPKSDKQVDYLISNGFRWSDHQIYTGLPTFVTLLPFGEKEWSLTYEPAKYGSLSVGNHTIVGEVGQIGEYGSAITQITVEAAPPLTITTVSLPSAAVGAPYKATVSASGGRGSYLWSANNLPPGLSLASEKCVVVPCRNPATISGTPTTAGIYAFAITVSEDFQFQKAVRAFTIQIVIIKPDLLIEVSTDKPTYAPNERIVITVSAKNKSFQNNAVFIFNNHQQADYVIDGKFRWSDGQTFTQSPTYIMLEPLKNKEWYFTHTFDKYPLGVGIHAIVGEVVGYGNASVQVTVRTPLPPPPPPPSPLIITTVSLPSAIVGNPYKTTVSASGGKGSYLWSASLPPGFSLTSEKCVVVPCQGPATISGTPTTVGKYALTITVKDDVQKAMRPFTITVNVTTQRPNLSYKVFTDKKTYTLYEDIEITVEVTNRSLNGTALNFTTSKQADYVIDEKFRRSDGKIFTQALTSVTLLPLKPERWYFTHTFDEYPLDAGIHTIVGEVVGYWRSSVEITVVGGTPFFPPVTPPVTPPQPPVTPSTLVVNVPALNVRGARGLDAPIIGLVYEGDALGVIDDIENDYKWTKVLTPNGVIGWVSNEYVTLVTTDEQPIVEEEAAEEELTVFGRNMGMGAIGPDVTELQKFLGDQGFYEGEATGYFGPITFEAVIRFQEEYEEILAPLGLSKGTGFVGDRTREFIEQILSEDQD